MLKYSMTVSEAERNLLQAIDLIGYGEIFGSEILDGEKRFAAEVSRNQRDLIALIRDGNAYLDIITIHQKEPVLVEVDALIRGFRCRKKIKLPTVPTEG